MDYKILEKSGSKFIDELPQEKSKKVKRMKASGEAPIKKDVRLPMVQIMAPILIVLVGIAVIQLTPDKRPSGSQLENAKGGTTPSPQTQASDSFSASTAVGDGKAASAGIATAEAVSAGIATAEAVTRDIGENQISVVSAVVCGGVQDRQPMDEKHAFTGTDGRRVYIWMEVRSKSQPFVIKHNYYLNGQKNHEVPLDIEHPRMRTWSYMTIDKPEQIGDWQVEIACGEHIMRTVEFQVSASAE